MPLAVSDFGFCVVLALAAVLLVQFFKLHDLSTEGRDLLAKDFEVFHDIKNSILSA